MNVQMCLTETETISGKQPNKPLPALKLWKQLTSQQQKSLAKHWAQLLSRMQRSLEVSRKRQHVED